MNQMLTLLSPLYKPMLTKMNQMLTLLSPLYKLMLTKMNQIVTCLLYTSPSPRDDL